MNIYRHLGFTLRVRYSSGAYVARLKDCSGSSTTGPEEAAKRAVAKALKHDEPAYEWTLHARRLHWQTPGAGDVVVTATAKGAS